jgi:hypothetical protein
MTSQTTFLETEAAISALFEELEKMKKVSLMLEHAGTVAQQVTEASQKMADWSNQVLEKGSEQLQSTQALSAEVAQVLDHLDESRQALVTQAEMMQAGQEEAASQLTNLQAQHGAIQTTLSELKNGLDVLHSGQSTSFQEIAGTIRLQQEGLQSLTDQFKTSLQEVQNQLLSSFLIQDGLIRQQLEQIQSLEAGLRTSQEETHRLQQSLFQEHNGLLEEQHTTLQTALHEIEEKQDEARSWQTAFALEQAGHFQNQQDNLQVLAVDVKSGLGEVHDQLSALAPEHAELLRQQQELIQGVSLEMGNHFRANTEQMTTSFVEQKAQIGQHHDFLHAAWADLKNGLSELQGLQKKVSEEQGEAIQRMDGAIKGQLSRFERLMYFVLSITVLNALITTFLLVMKIYGR